MFTSEDYGNIITFLSRVELKGAEAPVFVSLMAKLNKAGQAAQALEKAQANQAQAQAQTQMPAPAPVPGEDDDAVADPS